MNKLFAFLSIFTVIALLTPLEAEAQSINDFVRDAPCNPELDCQGKCPEIPACFYARSYTILRNGALLGQEASVSFDYQQNTFFDLALLNTLLIFLLFIFTSISNWFIFRDISAKKAKKNPLDCG